MTRSGLSRLRLGVISLSFCISDIMRSRAAWLPGETTSKQFITSSSSKSQSCCMKPMFGHTRGRFSITCKKACRRDTRYRGHQFIKFRNTYICVCVSRQSMRNFYLRAHSRSHDECDDNRGGSGYSGFTVDQNSVTVNQMIRYECVDVLKVIQDRLR